MTNSRSFSACVDALTGGDAPRVWSLLVTVFGDLGQSSEGRFSGALLRELTEPVGVRPEALRVALHRLRKEGWITSHRTGRRSDHVVTNWGRAEIAAAAPRIYTASEPAAQAYLIITEPGQPDASGVQLRSGVTLAPAPVEDAYCTQITDRLPDWMRDRTVSPQTQATAAGLLHNLRNAEAALPKPHMVSPIQRAVLRVLIVHGWRRVALRVPCLPDACLPRDSAIPCCRTRAMALLDILPAPETLSHADHAA